MSQKSLQEQREHADTARFCRQMVALRTDLELGINLNELRYAPPGG